MEPTRLGESFPMQLLGCEESGTESRYKRRSQVPASSAVKRPLPVNASALHSVP